MRLWTNLDERAYLFIAGLAAKLKTSNSKALELIVKRTMQDLEDQNRCKNAKRKRSRTDRS